MNEQLVHDNEQVEQVDVLAETPPEETTPITSLTTQEDHAKISAITDAREAAQDVFDKHEAERVIGGLDFSENKFRLIIGGNYQAKAEVYNADGNSYTLTGKRDQENLATRLENGLSLTEVAHNSEKPIEQVRVRKTRDIVPGTEERAMPRRGLAGKLGLKRKEQVYVPKFADESTYVFEYGFAAPGLGPNAAAGNHTGQSIGLSLEITKDQATSLSEILAKDPTSARTVLDTLMAKNGDKGAWNAEIYDEKGEFHDPGTRYDRSLLARDVRPNYAAMPDLKPQVIELLPEEQTPEASK